METAKKQLLRLGQFVDFSRVFSIDLRSLALVRILTALILLADLVTRFPDIAMMYGNDGVLPREQMYTFWMGDWAWSLHTLFGGPSAFVVFVFVVQILFATALLLGFWTRTVSVVSWVLLVSLQNANLLILLGGDFLLRQTFFAGMFVPWGEVFSLDRYFSKEPVRRMDVLSTWSAAFLIQDAFMYYFASMYKNSIEWNVTGSAFYYILSVDQYATSIGHMWLAAPYWLLQFLTIGVTLFQHFVVFLLFIPFLNSYIRTATAAILMLMHFCFGTGTHLGIFSWISMTALVAFMPDIVWNWIGRVLSNFRSDLAVALRRSILVRAVPLPSYQSPSALAGKSSIARVVSVLGIIYIVYMFLWQAVVFAPVIRQIPLWNTALQIPAKVLRLDQHWNLFAPHPYTDDGWDIIIGRLSDGSTVDLFRGGAPITYEKPNDVYALYYYSHVREYTLELRRQQNERYRKFYAQYLCATWNAAHTGNEHLESLEHIFMLEETPSPGYAPNPVVQLPLITYTCPAI